MTDHSCTVSFIFRLLESPPSYGGHSRGSQYPSAPVHVLDDDSLLNVLSFCRPLLLGDYMRDSGEAEWNRTRWWYGLVKVCHRWRSLVFESAFHLRLTLFCGRGTPVADMLANSPSLPLTIDYFDTCQDITAEDEEGILFALQHRDRIRHTENFRVWNTCLSSNNGVGGLIAPNVDPNTNLSLPESFRAPHLQHLMLMNFAIPIKSPTLTTIGNLVTLSLVLIPPSAHFNPNFLLQRLSLVPQLEVLDIAFNSNDPIRDAERQSFLLDFKVAQCLRFLGSISSSGHRATPREAQHMSLPPTEPFHSKPRPVFERCGEPLAQ